MSGEANMIADRLFKLRQTLTSVTYWDTSPSKDLGDIMAADMIGRILVRIGVQFFHHLPL